MSFPSRRRILITGLAIFAFWLVFKYFLPIAMPFLLALALSLMADPLVSFFQKSTRLPRWALAGLGVSVALTICTLILMTLGAFLLRELRLLADVLPNLETTALDGMDALQNWLTDMANGAPVGIRAILNHSLEGFFSDSTQILDKITGKLLGLASSVLTHLPDSALGFGTWILASYMISARLPGLRLWFLSLIPKKRLENTLQTLRQLRSCVGGWLLAQLKLMCVTLSVLLIGFFLLRISYAPLWALGVCLVDALPVLGTGTILIPWSIVSFLQGNSPRAFGLLGIYTIAALLRSVLEPKLVGKQLGLDPLLTLLCMYSGYRLFGLPGMLLSPLLAVTALQLYRSVPHEKLH